MREVDHLNLKADRAPPAPAVGGTPAVATLLCKSVSCLFSAFIKVLSHFSTR